MADSSRATLRWVGAAVAAILVLWLLLHESEPNRIAGLLDQFERAVAVIPGEAPAARRERIRRAFGEIFTPDARARIPDLGSELTGNEDLIEAACRLGDAQRRAGVTFDRPNIEVMDGGREATVNVRALLETTSAQDGLRTDSREVHARLRKGQRSWQVTQLVVAPHSTVEPEPRP